MTHDALDSAYARLGLRRGASVAAVKRRYRTLGRQWHPDQFANDPQGTTDATLMLKAINHAYKTIVEHHAPEAIQQPPVRQPGVSHQAADLGDRFTAQQTDEIIAAIHQSESLLSVGFDDGVAGWRSRAGSIAVVCIIAAMSWTSPNMPPVVIVCVLPLLCIWFPDRVGGLSGDNLTPAPALVVWLLGWGILLVLLVGISYVWLLASSL